MQKRFLKANSITHFSRWTRKTFAIFNSLNKVVKISGLSVALTAFALPGEVMAQQDTTNKATSEYELEEVEIVEPELLKVLEVPSRVISVVGQQELESVPIESVQGILSYLSQVDLRQRGNNDVQADISIRGGTFDQVLIMLNGVNITNPQTGHHNLDLPIAFDQIERVEILNGAGSQSYGANAYSGAINIITKSSNDEEVTLKAELGDFGLYRIGASMNIMGKRSKHYFSVNHDASNGYTENTDFQRSSMYYQGRYLLNNSFFEWQFSASDKQFGAQSFYTAKYPNQFEQTQNVLASLRFQTYSFLNLNTLVYWNLHSDRFELFRDNQDAPSWYKNHNYHATDVIGGNTKGSFASVIGKTTLGLDLRYEHIASNVLGVATGDTLDAVFNPQGFYTKEASRTNASFSVEQNYKYKGFSTIVALMFNYNTAYSNAMNFYPGVDLNYVFAKNWKVMASLNRSLRLPTFTDLYYAGPSNIGNPDLVPEEAVNIDVAANYQKGIFNLNAAIFQNYGSNSIDWIRKADSLKWQPMNLTEVTTTGFDVSINLLFNRLTKQKNFFINSLGVQYTYIDKQTNSANYESHYVLDYLKQKFVLSIDHKVYKKIGMSWKLRFQERNGNYMLWDADAKKDILTPYGSYTLLDGKVYWRSKSWLVYAKVSNIFDINYVDYGNVKQPARWFSVGVRKTFSLRK